MHRIRSASIPLTACLWSLLACSAARADELRLYDGRVLVGRVVEVERNGQAAYEVHTRHGVVVVPVAQVARRATDDELRRRLAESRSHSGSTPFAFLQLAIDARAYGLEPEMWHYLDATIERQEKPASEGHASRALLCRTRDFLAQLEPELLSSKLHNASTPRRVHELLDGIRLTKKLGRNRAIEELLVREPNADAPLRREARRNPTSYRRLAALRALARRGEGQQDTVRFVLRTTILDRSEKVRTGAADVVRAHGQANEDAIDYLAPGLSHRSAKVRQRTAEAYAELGHPAAIARLVAAGPFAGRALAPAGGGGGMGTRAHVAFLNQQAYIRDFDVEVAQASFIADPKVDVLQSGSVLDVTVAGVFEERVLVRVYRRALKRLAHSDPGPDPSRWSEWLAGLERERAEAADEGKRR